MLLGIALAVAGSGCADAKVESGEVSVLEFIPDAQRAGIAAGTSRYDATAAIHAARDKVQGTGKTLLLPPGNYYVGEVKFSGSNYQIRTDGVTFRQKPGLTGDNQLPPIITFPPDATNIRLGAVRLLGNLASHRDDNSQGLAVAAAQKNTPG